MKQEDMIIEALDRLTAENPPYTPIKVLEEIENLSTRESTLALIAGYWYGKCPAGELPVAENLDEDIDLVVKNVKKFLEERDGLL